MLLPIRVNHDRLNQSLRLFHLNFSILARHQMVGIDDHPVGAEAELFCTSSYQPER